MTTKFQKGMAKKGGRAKGTPNRFNADLKEMIIGALNQAGGKEGGQAYLLRQATENPTAFLSLVGKVLPMTVQGDPDNPLFPSRIDVNIVYPKG